jgi:hypothetical protein
MLAAWRDERCQQTDQGRATPTKTRMASESKQAQLEWQSLCASPTESNPQRSTRTPAPPVHRQPLFVPPANHPSPPQPTQKLHSLIFCPGSVKSLMLPRPILNVCSSDAWRGQVGSAPGGNGLFFSWMTPLGWPLEHGTSSPQQSGCTLSSRLGSVGSAWGWVWGWVESVPMSG